MKKLLYEIDDLLAHLEDFTHRKDGEDITKMRAKISLACDQLDSTGEVCEHKEKEVVPGVFGGIYCKKCEYKLE